MSIAHREGEPPGYRPDIDGLRAVAVLSVIGYHFAPATFNAGFVGVDIFFVISGYLISGIILAALQAGTFSVAQFYGRRVRRIFPALLVVLLACLAAGWWVLYADEYRQLGRHVGAGAGFFSNVVLWAETGYFDAAAETKPLLHLWTLAVEEQFYLVWPLILAYLCKASGARARTTLALLLASLAAGIYATQGSQAAAFYLPLFRFWELMAGALLAQLPGAQARSRTEAHWRSVAGVALLAACYAVIRPDSSFPGWRATLPVLGAFLLISAGPEAWFNRRVLSNRLLVGIGLISFPLYLWHWPLLSFFRILGNDAPLTGARATALLAASMALAWLTYVALERPVRTGGHGRVKALGFAGAMVVAGGLGLWVMAQAGWPSRPVNDRDPTFASRDGRNAQDVRAWLVDDCRLPQAQARVFRRCTRDTRGPERYALLGDSKAEALFAGLVRTSGPAGRWLFIGGSTDHDSVLPVLSDADRYSTYRVPARLALDAVRANPRVETVVLVAATRAFFHLKSADSIDDLPQSIYFDQALEGLGGYVRALVAAGKRVVLVADNPTLPDPKRCMANARITATGPVAAFFAIGQPDPRCTITVARHEELSAQYRRLLEAVQRIAPGRVSIFETVPHLCDMRAGVCHSFEGGAPLYSFSDHVSDGASTTIGKALNEVLARADAPGTAPRAPARASP